MNPDTNPFMSGIPMRPADFGLFTGRAEVAKELLSFTPRAATGRLGISWIAGERGIGKSSLAALVGHLAERDEHALVAHVHLGGVHKLEEMAREIYLGLLRDNQQKPWSQNLLDMFGERVERTGPFGVDIQLTMLQEELEASVSSLTDALGGILNKVGNDRKVIFLILDDINGLASNPKFAHWLKSTIDSTATRGTHAPIYMLFVGLRERLDEMQAHNPSVMRIFQPLTTIKPWSERESVEFFKKAFSSRSVQLEEGVMDRLTLYCGGLPTIAHAIGTAVWRVAEGDEITRSDADTGIRDVARSIGMRFIERDLIQALQSDHYHSILGKLAKERGTIPQGFSKQDLLALKLTKEEKKALNGFLTRMKKLGGIVSVEGGQRGMYRFPSIMHQMYFFMESNRLIKKYAHS